MNERNRTDLDALLAHVAAQPAEWSAEALCELAHLAGALERGARTAACDLMVAQHMASIRS